MMDDPISALVFGFIFALVIFPLFIFFLWLISIPFGGWVIMNNVSIDGFVTFGAGILILLGIFRVFQEGDGGTVGFLVGVVLALLFWRRVRDRIVW